MRAPRTFIFDRKRRIGLIQQHSQARGEIWFVKNVYADTIFLPKY